MSDKYELTEEQEKWLIDSLSRPEALTSDVEGAIKTIRSKVHNDSDTKPEREHLLKMLHLSIGCGDWGIPVEELKSLYPDAEDSNSRVDELMGTLNKEFSKLKGPLFAIQIFDDCHNISVEGKVAQVICLDDIENPRLVTLWSQDNK